MVLKSERPTYYTLCYVEGIRYDRVNTPVLIFTRLWTTQRKFGADINCHIVVSR